jgi:SNF2 family DNA or RNA helicase
MTSSLIDYIRILDTVHRNSVSEEANTIVELPENVIKVPLHEHQKASVLRMYEHEQRLSSGMRVQGESLYSHCGILGDSVGVGKSLMVLAHIARLSLLDPIPYQTSVNVLSCRTMFSIKSVKFSTKNEAGALIIVPHTLFRQWSGYIKEQTNLNGFCISKISQLVDPDFVKTLMEADVVLVSNTICRNFIPKCKMHDIRWKRMFIDEADTIHIPSTYYRDLPEARFIWFITASWVNMLYMNRNLYFDKSYINGIVFAEGSSYKHLQPHFLSRMATCETAYLVESFRVRSPYLYAEIISSTHPLRPYLVLKCAESFVKKSISLPELIRRTILCKSPLTSRILENAVSTNIQQMLHAGDIHSALKELNVKGKDIKSLIDGVTANLTKELSNLQKTYEFKESLEYSSATAKEQALKTLNEKISHVKDSIKSIEDRIQNFKTEVCPICYDEPVDHLVTPCCSRIFCASCLIMSLARNSSCPLCRGAIHPSKCTKIMVSENEIVDSALTEQEPTLPRKQDALLKIMKENPAGKFLIFSAYDNPFETIEAAIKDMGITVKHVKGNKDAVASILRTFEKGSLRCLLLNSRYAGAGLNITAATHVILLHAMTHEEEKQVLGRAYRIGRTGSLEFIKLLHKGEESYMEDGEANTAVATAATATATATATN